MISIVFPFKLLVNNDAAFELPLEQLLNPLGDFLDAKTGNSKRLSLKITQEPYDDEGTFVGGDSCSVSSLDFDERPRRVRFAECTTVVEIPSFRDYSDEDRYNMWTGCDEIDRNARRNTIEFRYENCDWCSVREEDEFVLCFDGYIRHPAMVSFYLQMEQARRQEEARRRYAAQNHMHANLIFGDSGTYTCAKYTPNAKDGSKKRSKNGRSAKSNSSGRRSSKRKSSGGGDQRGHLRRTTSFIGDHQRLPAGSQPSLTRFADS